MPEFRCRRAPRPNPDHSSNASVARQADSPRHPCPLRPCAPLPLRRHRRAALSRKSSTDTPRASASLQTVDHHGFMPARQRKPRPEPGHFVNVCCVGDVALLVLRESCPRGDKFDTYALELFPSDLGGAASN